MIVATSGRERVLQSARELFFTRGYAEVSMQQIAESVGLTKAALYYHFRDKDDLFAQVVVREMTHQRQGFAREIARGGTLGEILERLAHSYIAQLSPDVVRIMVDFKQHVPESRHTEVHQELDAFVGTLAGLFEQAAAHGEIRDISPRLGAFLFFHTLVAAVMPSLSDSLVQIPSDPAAAARLITSIVLHGIASKDQEHDADGAPG